MTVSENDLSNPAYWVKWSINAGLMNDRTNDTLYGYAYLVSQEVKSAEVAVDFASKKIEYKLYLSKKMHSTVQAYNRYMSSGGIVNLWLARRLVRKYGCLEFNKILNDFVHKLCGDDWVVALQLKSEIEYVDAK